MLEELIPHLTDLVICNEVFAGDADEDPKEDDVNDDEPDAKKPRLNVCQDLWPVVMTNPIN